MAKVVISADTDTGVMSATVNGEAIADVRYAGVSCYDYNGKGQKTSSFVVESYANYEGVTKTVSIMARNSEKIKSGEYKIVSETNYPDVVIVAKNEDDAVLKSAIEYISAQLKGGK